MRFLAVDISSMVPYIVSIYVGTIQVTIYELSTHGVPGRFFFLYEKELNEVFTPYDVISTLFCIIS